MDRVCNLTLEYPHARDSLLVQHRDIMSAIDAHNADGAESVIRAHLQSILVDLPKLESERPELFG